MIANFASERAEEQRVAALLAKVAANFENTPFIPALFLSQGDLQTFGAYL